ncbi:MAG: tricorn protease [Planctomycetota bacterium]|jgi:tricorn protease
MRSHSNRSKHPIRLSRQARSIRWTARAVLAVLATTGSLAAAQQEAELEVAEETLLLQEPTVSSEHIVFSYAGDLWITTRNGGDARRLTSSDGTESAPQLSPDGQWVAFTGQYQGNSDVYLISVDGGSPRRLTWHTARDTVVDWHPEGDRVVFRSGRNSGSPVSRLYEVALDSAKYGGTPTELELPRVMHASFNADATKFVYTPVEDAFRSWKRYRGGRVTPVWIYDRATQGVEVVPHANASDTFPGWLDGVVYFASDRDGSMDLYRYSPGEGPSLDSVEQITFFDDYDVRNMDVGSGVVVFEQAGAIHVYDPAFSATTRLHIRVREDGLAGSPRWQSVAGHVRAGGVSPNGKRAVFEARGEIITVPREHGAARNLTKSSGTHDRSPSWSPDGKSIAWFHDASDEYVLAVRNLEDGSEEVFDLQGGGFYYEPQWSPDGEHILFRDKTNRLAYLTLADRTVTLVARNAGSLGVLSTGSTWSPDSRWVAFEQRDPRTMYDRIALFEIASGETTAITDGLAAAGDPSFSPDGSLLYFVASIDVGPKLFGLDMTSSASRDWDANLYVAVLKADGEHPMAHRSDEGWSDKEEDSEEDTPAEDEANDEEATEESSKADDDEEKEAEEDAQPSIDLEGIGQRILALPLGSAQYRNLVAVKGGLLFLEQGSSGSPSLRKFDLKEREAKTLREDVTGFGLSGDGETLLFAEGRGKFQLSGLDASKPDSLAIDSVRIWVEPREEWPQTLREVWRIQRDYFYDPNMHGVDWDAMWPRYARFLPHVRHRSDLTLLIAELIGELACGHQYAYGGEFPETPSGPSVGLLGVNWEVDSDRYRIGRILLGQNWNPSLRSPMTEPGVNAAAGDYLIAVDGRNVSVTDNLYAVFENTAGRLTTLTLSASADGSDSREVAVLPLGSEGPLRRQAWVEDNRRRVAQLSGGRLAYIYMPNTGGPGREAFDRDFYSQLDKEGLVLDERFNGGGQVADYVIDVLSRDVRSYWLNREGWLSTSPFGLLNGPKVMVINERAGSGGDWMPWAFGQAKLGTLVGTRTWGGLVGISGYPPLMDGGTVTAASFGVMDSKGAWAIENVGVAPDVEVIQWPRDILAGKDPQLDRAVEIALEALKARGPVERPGYVPPKVR